MGRRLAAVPLIIALFAGPAGTTEAAGIGYAAAAQEPENLAKLLEQYQCELPVFFDAGGRYVGAVVRDNKIRIRSLDAGSASAKTDFLSKPGFEKVNELDVNRYLFELSTKGEAPYGTSQLDGFREDKYISGDGLKTSTESRSGKSPIELFRGLYPSLKTALEKCRQK